MYGHDRTMAVERGNRDDTEGLAFTPHGGDIGGLDRFVRLHPCNGSCPSDRLLRSRIRTVEVHEPEGRMEEPATIVRPVEAEKRRCEPDLAGRDEWLPFQGHRDARLREFPDERVEVPDPPIAEVEPDLSVESHPANVDGSRAITSGTIGRCIEHLFD